MKNKINKTIFVACDSSKLDHIKRIIKNTKTKRLKIIPKFGLQFFYSKNGRRFLKNYKSEFFLDIKASDIPQTITSALNSLKDLTNHLKSKPKSLVEAIGIGTIPHLIGVQLTAAAGVETRLIGAGGGADRLARLLGKNADIALFSAAGYLKHKPSGIKALVFFGPNRIPSIKDIPTAKELGYNVVWANPASWLGPKGMDKSVVNKWSSVLKQAI